MEKTRLSLVKVGSLRKAGEAILPLTALLLLAGVALAANGYEISLYVIGGGGGRSEAAPYTLDGTIGQAVVGVVGNSPYELCAGFWCGMGGHEVFLPLVLRNS